MKMVASMSDIAAKAGTSVAAVSVTLNGAKSKTLRISTETRARIMKAAEELGYRRNPTAGALATGRTHVLGLMLPYVDAYAQHDPFYSLITTGVTACAARRGYNVMLYTATAEEEGARAAAMIDKRVDGLILVSPPAQTPIYDECRRQRIAVVSIMGPHAESALSVDSDDYSGGSIGTRHLLDLGHRRIAHLEGKPEVSTSEPRKRGYRDALTEAGVAFDEELCLPGGFNRATSYESAKRLMQLPEDRRPTAIFAANDLSAHGAIDAIHDAGLKVPDDVAVVGYDDTWYATVVRPALTSVRMDVAAIGARAAESIIDVLDHGRSPVGAEAVLPVSLTIRDSCGAAKPD